MAEKIRVLIIDDEHDLCMVTKFALEGYAGYEVSYETDPRVAAKAAAFTKPDIIVLDIVMPGKDGFAVLDELKRNHYTR
jgi:DNA-binding response OmpR family regulator